MPATGRRWTRRAFLATAAVGLVRADAEAEAWEMITELAGALGRSSPVEFMGLCDPQMPGFAALRAGVTALCAAADVESGIDPLKNTGNDQSRDLEVDWTMQLVDRSGLGRVTRRRETVKCRVEKRGRKWKVVALEPQSFFAAPLAGMDLAHQRGAGLLLL